MRDGATDSAVEAYLDRLTDSYIYESSYAIITAHCTYTVFSKNNNDEIDKYNTEDFKFLLTAFCPIVNGYDSLSVELNVGSLGSEVNTTTYIANKPTGGFLYPAFNNRSSDINHIMVYDEKADVNIRFVDNFLECTSRVPAKVEKSQFHCLIKLLVGDDLSYELIIAINESLIDEINVHKNETEPCLVGEYELRTLLYDVFHMYGVDQNFDRFESIYNSVFGADTKVMISNLVDSKYVINIAGNKVSLSRLGEVAIESYTVVDTVRKRLVININEPSYTVNDYNILK